MVLEERVARDGVVDDAGTHQDAANLRDGAQHERAIFDERLDEVF